jgi:hypothetical protein
MNRENAPGAKQSAEMNFSRADRVDAQALNLILWQDAKGNQPMPALRGSTTPDD